MFQTHSIHDLLWSQSSLGMYINNGSITFESILSLHFYFCFLATCAVCTGTSLSYTHTNTKLLFDCAICLISGLLLHLQCFLYQAIKTKLFMHQTLPEYARLSIWAKVQVRPLRRRTSCLGHPRKKIREEFLFS